MARLLLAGLWLCVLSGAQLPSNPTPPNQKEQEPPEEDESLRPKEYVLNPLQAAKEITAGNYYFKKGNYTAAARRYAEATRWDPGSEAAFLKLGEVYEKTQNYAAAREAYSKYLELSKDAKNIDAVKKRMAKWPRSK